MNGFNKTAIVAVLSLALGGCGGGGGDADSGDDGGSDSVSLSSRQDALRELGLFAQMSSLITIDLPEESALATVKSMKRSGAVQTKQVLAEYEIPCDSGKITFQARINEYAFDFFSGAQSPVASGLQIADACSTAFDDGDFAITSVYDGSTEAGLDASLAFGFVLAGSGSTPFHQVYTESNAKTGDSFESDLDIFGQQEYVLTETSLDSRWVFDYSGFEITNGEEYAFSITEGTSSTPMKQVDTLDGSFTLDGPYRYALEDGSCGGKAELATLQPIETQLSSYVAGTIELSSGSQSLQIEFQPDGSAAVTYSSGGSDTLSADEVSTALTSYPRCS